MHENVPSVMQTSVTSSLNNNATKSSKHKIPCNFINMYYIIPIASSCCYPEENLLVFAHSCQG